MSESRDEADGPYRRLPRSSMLKRTSLIRPLFDRTRSDVGSLALGPLRIVYRLVTRDALPGRPPIQVGFAPGRIPTAVRRNRIKRVLREVYRVHQAGLVDLFCEREDALTMMIVFRGGADEGAAAETRIREDLPELLAELRDRIASTGETSMSAERRA